ncbi:hypothetical protein FD06_GL000274 [Apilactobacillus ozensis DSM 23829 = JCM 17196]|uniref:Uncharacterized protein n=1 Tax=Apilactobacillus ozensis DSM 23829 = JCM 17196 TaxID=1423781 RepID=A0A0R2ARH2_9LACO|nr:putative phage tail protein [Apilactobacillus ozensis]KRM69215.1 hypothetical protein FD06_GL000274 [Apilactobacillus ozensis DSM 23829 = JCM 17196]
MNDLKNNLPDYYDDVVEMNVIINAEQPIYDDKADYVDNIFANLFVKTADSQGLSILEHEYSLRVDRDADLDTRRYNILLRLLPPHPITLRYFKQLLSSFNIPVRLDVDSVKSLANAIDDTNSLRDDQIYRLRYLMNKMLPARLAKQISLLDKAKSYHHESIGSKAISMVTNISNPKLSTINNSNLNMYIGTKHIQRSKAISKMKGSD